MKLALKLLMVMAILVTVAGLSGWKWTTNTSTLRAADYALVPAAADGSGSITPAADMSVTPDANASVTPDGDTPVTPDGWTWD